jgi:hypothetical protein
MAALGEDDDGQSDRDPDDDDDDDNDDDKEEEEEVEVVGHLGALYDKHCDGGMEDVKLVLVSLLPGGGSSGGGR